MNNFTHQLRSCDHRLLFIPLLLSLSGIAGLVGMFSFQAFENTGMTMGVMPVTGIPLPFLSCGGTAMVSSMMGVGLLLSISCSQKI